MSVQFLLKSRGAGGDSLWIRDPGGHHPHGKCPGGFQDQVERRLTGGSRGRNRIGSGSTLWQCQNMVAHYIAMNSLLELCEKSERAPGVQVGMWWWKQTGINLSGAMDVISAAVKRGGGE